MSYRRSREVPWTIALAALVVAAGALAKPPAAPKSAKEQVLQTADGKQIVTSIDGRTIRARPAGGSGPIADGTYTLTNGGSVRVKGGEVVWDAFGAVEKIKKTGVAPGSMTFG